MACLAVRMPPAGLKPTARPVSRWKSRMASIITRLTGGVAAGWTLPVEVLMKSAPAAIARTLARLPTRRLGAERAHLAGGVRALQRGQVHAADRQVQRPQLGLLLDRALAERGRTLLDAHLVDRAHPPHQGAQVGERHRDGHVLH